MTVAAVMLLSLPAAHAKVYYARDEALALAFPHATRIEQRSFYLTPAQRKAIEERAQAPLPSDLLQVHVGYRDNTLLGYAWFDTHQVRTAPETILVVLNPDGQVVASHLLAFYEPEEYAPSQRWLAQFQHKQASADHAPATLQPGRDVDGISGATFTARAASQSFRRALAIYGALLVDGPAYALRGHR